MGRPSTLVRGILFLALGFTAQVNAQCSRSIEAHEGDTCAILAALTGITVAQFLKSNPTVTSCNSLTPGQVYCVDGTAPAVTSSSTSPVQTSGPLKVSTDGTCGAGVTCQGSEFGNCCSKHGFCGSSTDHCGDGCQPSLGTCSVKPSGTITSPPQGTPTSTVTVTSTATTTSTVVTTSTAIVSVTRASIVLQTSTVVVTSAVVSTSTRTAVATVAATVTATVTSTAVTTTTATATARATATGTVLQTSIVTLTSIVFSTSTQYQTAITTSTAVATRTAVTTVTTTNRVTATSFVIETLTTIKTVSVTSVNTIGCGGGGGPFITTIWQTQSNRPTPTLIITTRIPGGPIQPRPTPYLPGSVRNCRSYDQIQEGDSCRQIANRNSISLLDFYQLNPSVSANNDPSLLGSLLCTPDLLEFLLSGLCQINCDDLWPGYFVCVEEQ